MVRSVIKQVETGKRSEISKLISGTYIHCDLVPSIAGWICPEIQLKCNRIINCMISKEFHEKINAQQRSLKAVQDEASAAKRARIEVEEKLKAIGDKLDDARVN